MALFVGIVLLTPLIVAIDLSDVTFQHVSTEDLNGDIMGIGWIEYASCIEGSPNGLNYTGLYGQDIINISRYAVTVKILPSTGIYIICTL